MGIIAAWEESIDAFWFCMRWRRRTAATRPPISTAGKMDLWHAYEILSRDVNYDPRQHYDSEKCKADFKEAALYFSNLPNGS